MTIVEAMQKAENGHLITNNFMKGWFLMYMGEGTFWQYQIIEDDVVCRYSLTKFSFAEVISIGWEIVPNIYFKHKPFYVGK